MKYLLPLAILLFTVAVSCKKNDPIVSHHPPSDSVYNAIRDCSIAAHYDSATIATAMQGIWKQAWFDNGGARYVSDSELIVSFNASSRYIMLVNSRTMSAGTWSIVPAEGEFFKLKMTDTFAGYGGIPGHILTCGKGTYFDDNYPMGTRSYYVRQ